MEGNPKICSWVELSFTDTSELLDPYICNQAICDKVDSILELNPISEDSREAKRNIITRDIFYHLVLFARRESFGHEQLSALFTIVKMMHKLSISTPYDNTGACYNMMKELLVCHSVHRPPYSIQLYSLEQVTRIIEYILQSYFKHFKLYKYAFTKRVLLDLKITYEGVEDTPQPSQIHLSQPLLEDKNKEEATTNINNDDDSDQLQPLPLDGTNGPELEQTEDSNRKSLTQEQLKLQNMISNAMTERMKKLKLTVEKELADSNGRLSEKLEAMEAVLNTQPKERKGK